MTMRLLRYRSAKDVYAYHFRLVRCYHGRLNGVGIQVGPRVVYWMWRLCR